MYADHCGMANWPIVITHVDILAREGEGEVKLQFSAPGAGIAELAKR